MSEGLTVGKLMALLQNYPEDMPLARSCGGDCPGHTRLLNVLKTCLYQNPTPEDDQCYEGELMNKMEYESHLRHEEYRRLTQLNLPLEKLLEIPAIEEFDLPEGKDYLVIL